MRGLPKYPHSGGVPPDDDGYGATKEQMAPVVESIYRRAAGRLLEEALAFELVGDDRARAAREHYEKVAAGSDDRDGALEFLADLRHERRVIATLNQRAPLASLRPHTSMRTPRRGTTRARRSSSRRTTSRSSSGSDSSSPSDGDPPRVPPRKTRCVWGRS